MSSSPPPAGTGQEGLDVVSGEASLPLRTAETGEWGERGAPSASEDLADGLDDGEEGDAVEEDEDGGGGGGDDNDMEVGELEDEEEEDSDYSSGYSQGYDEEQFAADLEEVDSVGENLQKNAEEDGEGRQHTNPAVASCCVCMERWTSGGAHRICCIPCGHVYGRSCLEKWLRRCGGTTAKCPQCGESFEGKMIINLYGTEYLWNDCIHDQARLDEEKRLREEFERRQLEALEERMVAWQWQEERLEELQAVSARQKAAWDEEFAAHRAWSREVSSQLTMWNQMFTDYCAVQGLPPPPTTTFPPLHSPHTPHPSDAGSNEPRSSHTSPHDNPLGFSPPC